MNFYQELQSFGDFAEITRDSHYARVPDDWVIVVADIKGSTRAIEEGRYRDVNTLGAATIAVVHNQLGEDRFPFVFGGDGATMIIPAGTLDTVKPQLLALCALADRKFQLSLRVGAVPVADLQETRVEVAKLRIAGNRSLAVFRGGGLTMAEDLVKQPGSRYILTTDATQTDADANLDGLSCRWLPIPPSRDFAASLLVKARGDHAVYQHILAAISALYDGKLESANPVNLDGARYRSIRQCLRDERRYHRRLWGLKFAWRVFEITAAVLIFRHGAPGPFSAKNYAESMGRHSDYRKFDDMLRMVIDCSASQAEQLRELLESLRRQGAIDYGLHLAKESLMTCFFHGPNEGQHIHFIDGGDGGYVMAAKQLKQQLQSR